ncbi:ABC transporter permease [Brachybacterium muris]|uniref:ABC transporter permease n=1 Tax=Brachybacterium muris TaxID=219301 RepID=UPI00223BF8EE|nr:ABC transporter permease [Brachybacterium muris]MCT2261983.1 ABC transporter permease [Brachybacterium muris]
MSASTLRTVDPVSPSYDPSPASGDASLGATAGSAATAASGGAAAPDGASAAGGTAASATPAGRRRTLRPGVLLSALVLLLALAWALLPQLFAGHSPTATVGPALQAPSPAHWFGTDSTGRDLYTRVVHGASHSILAATVAVAVGLIAGTTLGVIAGSLGGLVEDAIMRLVDVLLAIPGLLLSLSVVILLGFGTTNAAIAVGVTSIATFARLSRSRVLAVRRSEYVEAAFGSGGTLPGILRRHVLPNSAAPVVALAALQLGSAILQISTLGFLGYGAPPPTPEWGLLIAEGRDYVATAWWLTLLPGLVVAAVVLATNRLSTAIRQEDQA